MGCHQDNSHNHQRICTNTFTQLLRLLSILSTQWQEKAYTSLKIYSIFSIAPKCIKCCQDRAESTVTQATKYKLQKSLHVLELILLPWECCYLGWMDLSSVCCCTHPVFSFRKGVPPPHLLRENNIYTFQFMPLKIIITVKSLVTLKTVVIGKDITAALVNKIS